MLNKLRSTQGFTLIELLIVVAIIGILAAIAIPQFSDYKKRSKDGASLSDIRNFKTTMVTLNNDTGTYLLNPASNTLVGTTAASAQTLTSAAASGQQITFQPSNNVSVNVESAANTFAARSWHSGGSKTYGVNDSSTVVYWKMDTQTTPTVIAATISGATELFTTAAWQSM